MTRTAEVGDLLASRYVNSIVGMTGTGEKKHAVPDDVTVVVKGEADAASGGAQTRLLSILPMLLGIAICGLNMFTAVWLWQTVYRSNIALATKSNLPTTIFLSLILVSTFIGIFLIGYAIVLNRLGRNGQDSQISSDLTANAKPDRISPYARWILVPILAALPAFVLTVWAAQIVDPVAPRPCIELYQEAANIKKDAPDFRMPWNDRDQIRCNINLAVTPK